ncbi:MAG TPA: hypothetical protein VH374_14020 [Polyangia bacterium]|jgi:hypothetical protein|nr:hypothetical protein [Polyangia bacterium]
MTRGLMAVLSLGMAMGWVGCSAQPTGLIVDLNDIRFDLDELQYGVSLAAAPDGSAPKILLDPAGKGRVSERLASGARLQQAIYVDDRYGGQDVICEVTGLSNGVVVATGNTAGSLRPQHLTEVTVILSAPDDEPAGADGGGGSTAFDAGAERPSASDMKDSGEGGASPPITDAAGSGGMTGAGGEHRDAAPDSGGGSGGGNVVEPRSGAGGSGGTGPAPGTGGRSPPPPPPPQKNKGATCQRVTDCAPGLFCVDGVCCTAPCIGGCRRCNDPQALGDCHLAAGGGKDPRGSCVPHSACEGNGTCNGNGGCAVSPVGTACGPASCQSKSQLMPAATCDGNGICRPPPPMMKCDKGMTCVDGSCRSMGS